ncbi:unnamed protein product [Schistosoma mattheei]|uniref:Uncharacterized protein n=1 Tax=Schistosoma mattheei TaxID=31246 RepID=A0A183NQK6_9TREM|nr:unnamed protein product [Schistosoma mattheei]
MAIRRIESEKAEGPDNIPSESLNSDIKVTASMLHVLLRKILEEEQVPLTSWEEGHLIKVPTKGDLSKCENHRCISTRKGLQQSVAEPDERLSRHPTPTSTDRVPWASVAHIPNNDTRDHR